MYRNKMGQDPAFHIEKNEPRHGYNAPVYFYRAPTPKARELMVESVEFAHLWLNNFALSASRKWKRNEAVHTLRQIGNRLRELNIQMLIEYLPSLRGEAKQRAHKTIAHLETLKDKT